MLRKIHIKHDGTDEDEICLRANAKTDITWTDNFKRDFETAHGRDATLQEYLDAYHAYNDYHSQRGYNWPPIPEDIWEEVVKSWEVETGKSRSSLSFYRHQLSLFDGPADEPAPSP